MGLNKKTIFYAHLFSKLGIITNEQKQLLTKKVKR